MITCYAYVKWKDIKDGRYFGTTTSDPFKYKGSGSNWLKYLGDATPKTEIIFEADVSNIKELKSFNEKCLNFSERNDIAKSPKWFNLRDEHGYSPRKSPIYDYTLEDNFLGRYNPEKKDGKYYRMVKRRPLSETQNDMLFTQGDVSKEQRLSKLQKPDFIEQKDPYEDYGFSEMITILLSTLTYGEERVIRMYYGIGLNTDYTLEEIAQQFSRGTERIRQILKKGLRKLRQPSRLELIMTDRKFSLDKIIDEDIEEERIRENLRRKRRKTRPSGGCFIGSKNNYWKQPNICKLAWWSHPPYPFNKNKT